MASRSVKARWVVLALLLIVGTGAIGWSAHHHYKAPGEYPVVECPDLVELEEEWLVKHRCPACPENEGKQECERIGCHWNNENVLSPYCICTKVAAAEEITCPEVMEVTRDCPECPIPVWNCQDNPCPVFRVDGCGTEEDIGDCEARGCHWNTHDEFCVCTHVTIVEQDPIRLECQGEDVVALAGNREVSRIHLPPPQPTHEHDAPETIEYLDDAYGPFWAARIGIGEDSVIDFGLSRMINQRWGLYVEGNWNPDPDELTYYRYLDDDDMLYKEDDLRLFGGIEIYF